MPPHEMGVDVMGLEDEGDGEDGTEAEHVRVFSRGPNGPFVEAKQGKRDHCYI